MACFLVPAAEAIITATATKTMKSNEEKTVNVKLDGEHVVCAHKISFVHKLGWLTKLLAGGSVLLAFEHVWHGEVTPWFPFLTAALDPADTAEMLHEMSTTGVTMAVMVTLVWAGMLLASHVIEKRAEKEASLEV